MKRRFVTLTLAVALLFGAIACAEPFAAHSVLEVTVLEREESCTGPFGAPEFCLLVRWPDQREAQPFFGEIEGFEFRYGLQQRLLVERLTLNNPPADGSSSQLRLLRTLERKAISVVVIEP